VVWDRACCPVDLGGKAGNWCKGEERGEWCSWGWITPEVGRLQGELGLKKKKRSNWEIRGGPPLGEFYLGIVWGCTEKCCVKLNSAGGGGAPHANKRRQVRMSRR